MAARSSNEGVDPYGTCRVELYDLLLGATAIEAKTPITGPSAVGCRSEDVLDPLGIRLQAVVHFVNCLDNNIVDSLIIC